MAVGAGLFAIVAADAQLLIDQQHIGRLTDAVVDQELCGLGIEIDCAGKAVLLPFNKGVGGAARGHVGHGPLTQLGIALQQFEEAFARQADHFGLDRGLDRGGAGAPVDHRHFTEI